MSDIQIRQVSPPAEYQPSASLAPLHVSRKTGREAFRDGTAPLGFDLLAFWQWSGSDLVSNTLRGRLAEFLVAQALGLATGVRAEWDAYDLRTDDGLTIEVKSTAYLQTWGQKELSAPCFSIRASRRWDPITNDLADDSRRQADLYVFALLAHQEKQTVDPLDLSQWRFYLVPTALLNERVPHRKSLSLAALLSLQPVECTYGELAAAVQRVRPCTAGGRHDG